jgi:hypothetical protein
MDANTIKSKFNNFWTKNIATKPIVLSTTERSDSERKSILEKQIIFYASAGWSLETQTEFAAVMSSGKRLNHILHLLLSVVTLGFWLIIWLFLLMVNRITKKTISVDKFGNTSIQNRRI